MRVPGGVSQIVMRAITEVGTGLRRFTVMKFLASITGGDSSKKEALRLEGIPNFP